MRRRAAITWRIPSIHARGYRLPAGTFSPKDPRAIYDSQVHRLCLLLHVFGTVLTQY
jgi:hypothetical protein